MGVQPTYTYGYGHNSGAVPPKPAAQVFIGEKFIPLFGDDYRHAAYYGGRGSAKSHSVATVLSSKSAKVTKRIVCARQFQNSIRDSVKELLELKMREMGIIAQFGIYDREIVHKATESRFTFIGLDRNPDSAKSLEGADICWVEEARTINSRSMEILIPTIRKPGSQLIWTWNPEFRDDPVDSYFRGPRQAELAKILGEIPDARPNLIRRVGIEDNPWFYHTPMAQEMLLMMRSNYARYLHVWLGGYDDGYESKVFSNILIARLSEIPDVFAPRYGMDFGFGNDPSFITKTYVNEGLKQIYIQKEACGRVPLRDLPAMMDSVLDDREDLIKADSSQPGTIEHLCSQGFNMVGAKKGPGSVKAGINWLQGYKIIIDPDCEEMREEARLYSWQVDKITKKRLSVPIDAHNHGWDSVRYGTEDAQLEDETDEDDGTLTLRFRRKKRH